MLLLQTRGNGDPLVSLLVLGETSPAGCPQRVSAPQELIFPAAAEKKRAPQAGVQLTVSQEVISGPSVGRGDTALVAPCPVPGANRVGVYPIYTTTAVEAVPGGSFGAINL